jgi:hypothetical protein
MARLTARQLTVRRRVESLIRVLAPGLDLLLATGERVARLAGPDDRADEWPPRPLDSGGSRRVTSIGR